MNYGIGFDKEKALSVLIAFLAWLAAVFPSGVAGYVAPGLISTALGILVIVSLRSEIRLGTLTLFLIALLASILNTAATGAEGVWVFRDYMRLIFLTALLAIYPEEHKRIISIVIGILLFVSLLFDFIILLSNAIPAVASFWYSYAVNIQFQEYIEGYYRHLGILGSPNLSAAYYLIAVYSLLFLIPLPKPVAYSGAILGFALLVASQSRSHLIAVVAAFLIGYRGIWMTAIQICLALIGIFGALDYLNVFDVFTDRFDELSSLEDRILISKDLFSNASVGELLFGSAALPAVVDNDVSLFLLRFGIVLFAMLVIMISPIIFRVVRIGGRSSLGFVAAVLISSVAGGVIGHPGLFILATVIFRVCERDGGLVPLQTK